jgi:hypothetical protein
VAMRRRTVGKLATRVVSSDDPGVQALSRQVNETVRAQPPWLSGVEIATSRSSAGEVTVPHGLGRHHSGYIMLRLQSPSGLAAVHEISSTDTTITFYFRASAKIKVWVF